MSNYSTFKNIIETFVNVYKKTASVESDLHKVSLNDAGKVFIYDAGRKNLQVINMDAVAHGSYRWIRYPESKSEEDSIATSDGFLINADGEWFFVEFKDQQLIRTKDSVMKKVFGNWQMVLDILYEMKEKISYPSFTYDNPVAFAKDNITYILVVSAEKNIKETKLMRDCNVAGMHYTPPFMEKIKRYIFHDAYAYTPDIFEREFVKKFQY